MKVTAIFEEIRIQKFESGKPFEYIHLKRDGYAIAVFKDEKGEMFAHTKTPRTVTSGQEWYIKLQDCLPRNTIVLGELFWPSGSSKDVRSILANNKIGEFEIFAAKKWEGEDVRECDWVSLANEVHKTGLTPVALGDTLSIIPSGYEGFVLKNKQWPVKPYDWMKKKKVDSIDVRVTGINPPKTIGADSFGFAIGSLAVQTDDGRIKVNVSSGLSFQLRKEISENKNAWIGQVIEVVYTEKESDGTLRHPRFIRIRDDKNTTD